MLSRIHEDLLIHKPAFGTPLREEWANKILAGWAFNEGGGTTVYDIKRKYHGPFTVLTAASWGQGVRGPYITFVAADTDWIVVNSGVLAATKLNASIFAWIRTSQSAVAGGHTVYSERASSGNDIWKLSTSESGGGGHEVAFVHRDDAGTLTQVRNTTTTINNGLWHHIGFTKRGTSITLYIDGVIAASGTLSGTDTFTNSGISCRIGADIAAASNDFEGDIESMFLFDTALTDSEVFQLYQHPYLMYEDPFSADRDGWFVPALAGETEKWFITSG